MHPAVETIDAATTVPEKVTPAILAHHAHHKTQPPPNTKAKAGTTGHHATIRFVITESDHVCGCVKP